MKKLNRSNRSNRRHFLLQSGGAAAALALGPACLGGAHRRDPLPQLLQHPFSNRSGRAAVHFSRGGDWLATCEEAIFSATHLSWLGRGDSVFIKVACNSGNAHPATTAPEAIVALVQLLKARGAGRIWVGDQAGAQAVRLTPHLKKGATHRLMKQNGIWRAILESGAHPWCFDDFTWDSYVPAQANFAHLWGNDLHVADALLKADHVINLCRLSTHALAGYTAGLKNAVGWLRDDSRGALHRDGALFFERIADITAMRPLADKLRFTLTLANAAQLNIGPDIGSVFPFEGPMAIVAENVLDHDSVVAALLPFLDRNQASAWDLYAPYPQHSAFFNKQFVRITWGEEAAARYTPIVGPVDFTSLSQDAMRARFAIATKYRPRRIEVVAGGRWLPDLKAHLRASPDGLVLV
jgi:uncharacterized protein (DUF362 family)